MTTDSSVASDHEIIDELMAEGFEDPLLPRWEPTRVNIVTVASQVTVAAVPRNESGGEVPEGVPC